MNTSLLYYTLFSVLCDGFFSARSCRFPPPSVSRVQGFRPGAALVVPFIPRYRGCYFSHRAMPGVGVQGGGNHANAVNQPVTLTIHLPPCCPCSLCLSFSPIVNQQHPSNPTRCHSCQTHERCTRCKKVKRRKHFHTPRQPLRSTLPLCVVMPASRERRPPRKKCKREDSNPIPPPSRVSSVSEPRQPSPVGTRTGSNNPSSAEKNEGKHDPSSPEQEASTSLWSPSDKADYWAYFPDSKWDAVCRQVKSS